MNIKEIIAAWLKDNGYDGLNCEQCYCKLSDIMPCDGQDGYERCEAVVFLNNRTDNPNALIAIDLEKMFEKEG